MNLRPKSHGSLILVLLVCCFTPPVAAAAERPSRASLEAAVNDFRRTEGDQWIIRADRDGITPRSLIARNANPLPGWSRDPAAAAMDWVRGHGAVLGPSRGQDGLRIKSDRSRRGVRHLRLEQTYKGVPVTGGEYAVAVEESGTPRMITGRFYRDLEMDVSPVVSAASAQGIAGNELPATRASQDAPRLTIYPLEELGRDLAAIAGGNDALVWEVSRIEPPHDVRWRVLVNARSGIVIAKASDLLHLPPEIAPEDCTSQGQVHVWDPPAGVSTFSLPGLRPGGNSFCPPSLRGTHVNVHNSAGANAFYTTFTGDFFFDPNDLHFAEVNAYYHMETFIGGFMGALGYEGLVATPGNAYVNATSSPCGTCYNPNTHSWYFIRGSGHPGFENMALAADIVTHESQHAVTSSFGVNASVIPGAEASAIHEGLSDYFAAAYTGEPRMGEWAYPSSCPDGITRVDSDPLVFRYSSYGTVGYCNYSSPNTPHANGMIFSGALWTLRGLIGPLADQLVLDALDLVPSQPDFGGFADAVWAADQARGGGHAVQIDAAFWQREIYGSQPSTITGPSTLAPNQQGTFSLVPTYGRPPENPAWYKRCKPCTGQPSCGDWILLGSGQSITTSSDRIFDLKATWTGTNGSAMEAAKAVNVVTGTAPSALILGPTTVDAGTNITYSSQTTGVAPLMLQWSIRVHTPDAGWLPWTNLGTQPTQNVFASGDYFYLKLSATDPYCRGANHQITVTVQGGGEPQPGESATPRKPGIVVTRVGHSREMRIDLLAPASVPAKLSLFDILGRKVDTMWEGRIEGGRQSIHWADRRLKPGLYVLRLDLPSGSVNRRVFWQP